MHASAFCTFFLSLSLRPCNCTLTPARVDSRTETSAENQGSPSAHAFTRYAVLLATLLVSVTASLFRQARSELHCPQHDQDVPRCFHAGDLARKNDDALSDDQLPPPPPKHHWVTQAREGTSSRDADLNASREAESTSGYKAKAKGEEGWEEGGEEERAACPFFAAGSSPAGKEGAREKFGELREVYCQVLGCGCMAPLLPLPFLSLSPPTKFCCSRVSLLFVPYYISLFHPSALLN